MVFLNERTTSDVRKLYFYLTESGMVHYLNWSKLVLYCEIII